MLQEFIDYLEMRQKSESTISSYKRAIKDFRRFINKPLLKAKITDVDGYVAFKRQQGNKNTTINVKLNGIKRFYKLMERNHGIGRETRKIINYELLNVVETERDVLDEDDVMYMLDELEDKRGKALLAVMFQTGMRISELVNLKKHNIWEREEFVIVNITKSKRNKTRKVFMNHYYYSFVKDYLKNRKGKSKYIFITSKNRNPEYSYQPFSTNKLRQRVVEISENILGKRVLPHDYRASCFTYLHKKGVDIYTIAEIAGHDNIQTTKRYIYSDDEDTAMKALAAFKDK